MKLENIAALLVRFVAILVFLGGLLLSAFIALLSLPVPLPAFADATLHDTYLIRMSWHGSPLVMVASFILAVLIYALSRPLGRFLAKGLREA